MTGFHCTRCKTWFHSSLQKILPIHFYLTYFCRSVSLLLFVILISVFFFNITLLNELYFAAFFFQLFKIFTSSRFKQTLLIEEFFLWLKEINCFKYFISCICSDAFSIAINELFVINCFIYQSNQYISVLHLANSFKKIISDICNKLN